MNRHRASVWSLTAVASGLALVLTGAELSADDMAAKARQMLDAAGVKGGLIVHLGCGDGKLTAALRANDSFIVHGLDADPKNVEAARKHIQALGLQGKVSVDRWDGQRLPYVDNLVNLLVCESASARVSESEVMRVLAPGGVALSVNPKSQIPNPKSAKPWPQGMDEWTHYLHGPDNNAVAQDTLIGPPKHYQWIGSPNYLRHHDHLSGFSAMVSAKGRLFYIMDLGPRWSIQMPPKWTLIARDAFNGVILWQRPIEKWHPHLWPLKRGPAQLTRRLVAEGDTVYVTLGQDAPISALDAARGQTVRTFAGTDGAEEMILSGGVLYALVNPEGDAYKTIPTDRVEAIRGAGREWNWDEKPRRLVAVQAATGRTLWRKESCVAPCTLAAVGGRVYFHDGDKVVCLDAANGQDLWASKPLPRWKPMHVLFSPTLVVYQDVVLFAGGENLDPQRGGKDTMAALSAKTGEVLWTGPHPPSGYASAEDLFVVDGLVWCGDTSNPGNSGVFTGRDPRTGEVKVEFPPDDWRHMPHHRCHRAKATCNYILTSRTGIEFVDFRAKHWTSHHWVRGSCNYGILPCNGLIYAPPHSCACYLLAKLNGFNALAAQRAEVRSQKSETDRLERGGAYGQVQNPKSKIQNGEDWPMYRHDLARSGSTKASVPTSLKLTWQVPLGGKLSALTVAEGKLFVASVDTHTVHALDANTGKTAWSFTAGGRVDSPPTIWQGRVLFGSADGRVYCLRAADGALVWRFRAAPSDQRLMAHEQVESVWPVSGSVLVRDGVVYCVAGRSMWLDGGMRFLRLDAATGRMLSEAVLDDKYPGTDDTLQKDIKWPNLPVALPDILSYDGRYVYMRAQPFDLDGKRPEVLITRNYKEQRGETAHLFAPTGFLDDSWWHRTYWMWGRSFVSGAGGWQLATYQAPAGKILVVDDSSVYGFGPAPLKFIGTPNTYHLFACSKEPKIINPYPNQQPRKQGTSIFGEVLQTRLDYGWSQPSPLLARALVLADQTLFAAGPPMKVDEVEVYQRYGDAEVQAKMAEHVAAFEGRKGALLMAVGRPDGKRLVAYKLDSPPVFDGMIAAAGRLFMATMDGKVLCLGSEGEPLVSVSEAELGPAPTAAAAEEAKLRSEFHHLSDITVARSDLGYRLTSVPREAGLALKKLPTPLTKQATFRVKVRASPGAATDRPGNGFIAFGNAPEDEKLVKCGFRVSGKALSIVQGPLSGGRAAGKKADVKSNEVMEMQVVVDLAAQKATLTLGGETLEAALEPRLDAITWVGVCLTSVTTDFGPIEVNGQ